jgi:hypothetical protein
MNKPAKQLEGNVGKYAGGRSVTDRGRHSGCQSMGHLSRGPRIESVTDNINPERCGVG